MRNRKIHLGIAALVIAGCVGSITAGESTECDREWFSVAGGLLAACPDTGQAAEGVSALS
ncbi:hypothetical protein GCM10010483_26680 [Actinokineospora diospyrosa]